MTGLFGGVLTRGPIGPLTDDTAWLGALLGAEHRLTPIPGRTLLQQALPTTFGAVGTLASLQEHGPSEAADSGQDLFQILAEHLEGIRTREQVAALLEPADHLGSAPTFTDRVIAGTTGRTGTEVHHSDNEEGHDER